MTSYNQSLNLTGIDKRGWRKGFWPAS